MKVLLTLMLLFAVAATAGANSFTKDGLVLEPSHGYEYQPGARENVPDNSFEYGTCYDGGSSWTCTSSNDCDWIADLVPLGLWNYDGNHVAWLGGFCGGVATDFTSICQSFYFDYGCFGELTWFWMAYVNDGGSVVSMTIDGETLFTKVLAPEDHLLDYQMEFVYAGDYLGGTHELCFEYDRNGATGDNYFVDFVQLHGGLTPVGEGSFSTVKSLY